ncbi:MAG: iron complex outermembrane receptor protein [Halioglobus sp.]|jgi:iron complex outermembrane receptor protein
MSYKNLGRKKNVLSLAAGIAAVSLVSQVSAQGLILEEVIVTAQKRTESLQDVPIAVTAISGDKILSASMQDLVDLTSYVPNVSITPTGGGGSPGRITIRGIGSGNNAGFEQSVGMFVDGVYSGRSFQYLIPFLDVGSVEVLKGPQGSLFGKNTVAGAMVINSARPTDSVEGSVRAQYEFEYGSTEYIGVVSGPVTDKLRGRVAAKYRNQEGYFENVIRGSDEAEVESAAVRGSFVYDASDNLELYGKLEYATQDSTGGTIQALGIAGNFRGLRPQTDVITHLEDGRLDDKLTLNTIGKPERETNTLNTALHIDWDMGGHTLIAITGYSEYDTEGLADGDMSDIFFLETPNSEDFDQISQEIRISSPGGETLDYIAGIYVESQNLSYFNSADLDLGALGGAPVPDAAFTPLGYFDQEGATIAVFGQATWQFADAFSVTAGLRYSYEEKDATINTFTADYGTRTQTTDPVLQGIAANLLGRQTFMLDEDRDTDNWSPTLNFVWDYSDMGMAYVRISRGYKSGGFNPNETAGNPETFEFDDERVDSIELGSKTALFGGAATLNVAAFYSEFSNRQVSTFSDNGFIVGNAAESTTQGVEAEMRFLASEYLSFGLSLAYLNSEYDDYQTAACAPEQVIAADPVAAGCVDGFQDLSGKSTIWAPDWSGTFTSAFHYPVADAMEFRADLDILYSDELFLNSSLDSNLAQDATTKVNARLALASTDDTWVAALVGKNLTDETTLASGAGTPFFTGSYFGAVLPPRTIALELAYTF